MSADLVTDALVQRVCALVQPARLVQDVEAIARPRSRLHWPAEIESAERWIASRLETAGWAVARQTWAFENVRGLLDYRDDSVIGGRVYERLDGVNVLAGLPDLESAPAALVAAHYDSVRDSPGADDNASGVAVLLELARVLPALDVERPVLLAALDMEELGFFGSRALAERLVEQGRAPQTVVLESVGYRSRRPHSQRLPPAAGLLYPSQWARIRAGRSAGDWALVLYRRDSTGLARHVARAVADVGGSGAVVTARDASELAVVGRPLGRLPLVRSFARSDHVSFWSAGIPAVQLTDTAPYRNPNYHRETDEPATLDYSWMAELTAATALTILRIAGQSRQ